MEVFVALFLSFFLLQYVEYHYLSHGGALPINAEGKRTKKETLNAFGLNSSRGGLPVGMLK